MIFSIELILYITANLVNIYEASSWLLSSSYKDPCARRQSSCSAHRQGWSKLMIDWTRLVKRHVHGNDTNGRLWNKLIIDCELIQRAKFTVTELMKLMNNTTKQAHGWLWTHFIIRAMFTVMELMKLMNYTTKQAHDWLWTILLEPCVRWRISWSSWTTRRSKLMNDCVCFIRGICSARRRS